MAIVDPSKYELVPFEVYSTLSGKMNALMNGEVLFIKKFERQEGADVLVRLQQKKYSVTQISYDVRANNEDPRYWVTFNLGINDLSLFTCFRFVEDTFQKGNKFMINDVVSYISEDGRWDTALIDEVYMHVTDPTKFAYRLSRDNGIYEEEGLAIPTYQ